MIVSHSSYKRFLLSVVGAGQFRPGAVAVHASDRHIRDTRNESQEHRHNQDPYHCGADGRQLSGPLLARGTRYGALFICRLLLNEAFAVSWNFFRSGSVSDALGQTDVPRYCTGKPSELLDEVLRLIY